MRYFQDGKFLERTGATMFLEKIDFWIIDNFWQPYADRINDRWGRSNFWVAKVICIITLMSWLIIWAIIDFGLTEAKNIILTPGVFLGQGLTVYFQVGVAFHCHILDKKMQILDKIRAVNPFRQLLPWGMIRLNFYLLASFITAAILTSNSAPKATFGSWWNVIGLIGFLTVTFTLPLSVAFAGCTPKPRRPLPAKAPRLAAQSSSV